MKFEEVREGDTVRIYAEFTDGTVIRSEFTVRYANEYVFGNDHIATSNISLDRKSLSIELVYRKPQVGDLMTGAQVQRLPDLAVFRSSPGVPRIVLNGMSYSPGLAAAPLSYHDFTDPTYRLIYLPDEEN